MDAPNTFLINRSQLIGRFDAPIYRDAFSLKSNIYPIVKLSEIVYINPTTSFNKLDAESVISFVPMEAVDDKNGAIRELYTKKVKDSKGFTRFQENDLIWAKITPCMQNGKSAIVRNTINGVACGSTEFFVLRKKADNIIIEYIHYILRDNRVLHHAMNFFGGSAGQQRVSKDFLYNFKVPLPPIEIQKVIVQNITNAYTQKQQNETKANELQQGIDTYILCELGINIPGIVNNLENRCFTINFSALTGSRFDPKLYDISTTSLRTAIKNSKYKAFPLKNYITQSVAGDWGKDENEKLGEDYIKCLVIRATEFDNNGNLNLDNSRVKYRLIHKEKLNRIDIQTNDLLIEKSGGSPDQPVGRIAILTEEHINNNQLCYSNFIHKIRIDNSKLNPEYLFYFLKTIHNIKLTEAMQSQTNGIRNLIMSNYFNQYIIVPDYKIQASIVKHIKGILNEIQRLRIEAISVLDSAKLEVEKMIIEG
jgi:restriction endonuclease S subunit